jgi:hypothetical protein
MKKENILYTVLLLLVFSAVAFVAMKYVAEISEVSSSVETFGNSTGLVTMAAKCNCMPGYVANKNASGSYDCLKLCDGGSGWRNCSETRTLPCY